MRIFLILLDIFKYGGRRNVFNRIKRKVFSKRVNIYVQPNKPDWDSYTFKYKKLGKVTDIY